MRRVLGRRHQAAGANKAPPCCGQHGILAASCCAQHGILAAQTHLKLNVRQHFCDALTILIHNFHPEPCPTLGLQVVINQVLGFQVALADTAGVVLAQAAGRVATTRAPAQAAPAWIQQGSSREQLAGDAAGGNCAGPKNA